MFRNKTYNAQCNVFESPLNCSISFSFFFFFLGGGGGISDMSLKYFEPISSQLLVKDNLIVISFKSTSDPVLRSVLVQ